MLFISQWQNNIFHIYAILHIVFLNPFNTDFGHENSITFTYESKCLQFIIDNMVLTNLQFTSVLSTNLKDTQTFMKFAMGSPLPIVDNAFNSSNTFEKNSSPIPTKHLGPKYVIKMFFISFFEIIFNHKKSTEKYEIHVYMFYGYMSHLDQFLE